MFHSTFGSGAPLGFGATAPPAATMAAATAPPRASVSLDAATGSVAEARHFSAHVLTQWGLSALRGDVQLVVSELVTNACRYACAGDTGGRAPIELVLEYDGTRVTCKVTDPSTSEPCPTIADEDAESGRGLQLVSCFSENWGWALRGPAGKVVWATFPRP